MLKFIMLLILDKGVVKQAFFFAKLQRKSYLAMTVFFFFLFA